MGKLPVRWLWGPDEVQIGIMNWENKMEIRWMNLKGSNVYLAQNNLICFFMIFYWEIIFRKLNQSSVEFSLKFTLKGKKWLRHQFDWDQTLCFDNEVDDRLSDLGIKYVMLLIANDICCQTSDEWLYAHIFIS